MSRKFDSIINTSTSRLSITCTLMQRLEPDANLNSRVHKFKMESKMALMNLRGIRNI